MGRNLSKGDCKRKPGEEDEGKTRESRSRGVVGREEGKGGKEWEGELTVHS